MPGVWQLRYEDDLLDHRNLRDFVWLKEFDDGKWLQAGHQQINLHPLLPSVQMTGVQYAWTSKPQEMQRQRFHPREILGRDGKQQRSFQGKGPIGGTAELWINDQKTEITTINLNGEYAFSDVPLSGRQSSIEIRTFDRSDLGTPVNIRTSTISLNGLMLDVGATTAIAGAGLAGNILDSQFNQSPSNEDNSPVAFGLVRRGVTEDITLEAAAELRNESATIMLGAVTRITETLVGSASVAINQEGHLAYDLEARLGP